jgi:hypothetical protein
MGIRVGLTEQRSRTVRWKAMVELLTRKRKKRYCRMRGCAWRIAAFVTASPDAEFEVFGVVEVEKLCEARGRGRLSFSMRAQVRYTSKRRRRMPRRIMDLYKTS